MFYDCMLWSFFKAYTCCIISAKNEAAIFLSVAIFFEFLFWGCPLASIVLFCDKMKYFMRVFQLQSAWNNSPPRTKSICLVYRNTNMRKFKVGDVVSVKMRERGKEFCDIRIVQIGRKKSNVLGMAISYVDSYMYKN